MILSRLHIIPLSLLIVQRKDPSAFSSQLWEPLLHEHKGSQTAENLKRLVVRLVLCCWCFCFYCPGIHDGLMNRGPVLAELWCPCCSRVRVIIGALLGIAHMLRNSAASRLPDVGVCFYPVFMLLFSQRAATTTACCLYVFGQAVVLSVAVVIFSLCCMPSEQTVAKKQKNGAALISYFQNLWPGLCTVMPHKHY